MSDFFVRLAQRALGRQAVPSPASAAAPRPDLAADPAPAIPVPTPEAHPSLAEAINIPAPSPLLPSPLLPRAPPRPAPRDEIEAHEPPPIAHVPAPIAPPPTTKTATNDQGLVSLVRATQHATKTPGIAVPLVNPTAPPPGPIAAAPTPDAAPVPPTVITAPRRDPFQMLIERVTADAAAAPAFAPAAFAEPTPDAAPRVSIGRIDITVAAPPPPVRAPEPPRGRGFAAYARTRRGLDR